MAWKRVNGTFEPAIGKVIIQLADPLFPIPGSVTIGLMEDGSMSILRKKVRLDASDYTGVLKKQP